MTDQEWFEKNQGSVDAVINPERVSAENRGKELLEKSKRGFLSWDEMMELPHEENNYLIDKFLWEGQVAMILAKEKVGKSILSKQMICALTSGQALFDEYDVARECTVCYLQLEGDRGETKSRFKSMAEGVDVGSSRFHWRFYDRLHLDKDKDADTLIEEIRSAEIKPDVIFMDPVYMACSGSLSNDEVVRSMIGNIRRIQEVFNCAVILVHHEHRAVKDKDGKHIEEGDNAIMGSFAFKAFVSHVIRVTLKGKPPNQTRVLKCDTQRNGAVAPNVELVLNENPLMYRKNVGAVPKGMGESLHKYIKRQKSGCSAIEFCNKYQTPRTTVDRAMTALRNSGHIVKCGKRGREVLYKVTEKKEAV